jgi:thiol-disulfide isomerase/thioredoxin
MNTSKKFEPIMRKIGTIMSSSRLLSLATIIVLVMLIYGCNSNDKVSNSNAPAPVISNPPRTALPMPPVNGKSIDRMGWVQADGRRSAFGEFKGKVLILDFYATWCEPCRDSIPHLVDLQQRYQDEVRVIGLNVGGEDDIERVPEFAKRFNIQYALGQPDDELVELLLSDNQAIPQTFVFDRHGLLTRRFVGYGYDTGDEIDQAVAAALQSSAD